MPALYILAFVTLVAVRSCLSFEPPSDPPSPAVAPAAQVDDLTTL